MPSRASAFLNTLWRTRYKTLTPFFWLGAGTIFINDNFFEPMFITGTSMAPTLSPAYKETGRRDVVLWRKWFSHSEIKRGDVVHFMNPLRPEVFAVKRVIGMEGDVVFLDKRRRPRSNGLEGPEPYYMKAWDAFGGKVKVPEGHLWVEGDNMWESRDSNTYGPISKSLVTARTTAVVWPPSRFGMTPWDGFKSQTKVLKGRVEREWTDGLPVELAEITDPHLR